MTTSAVTASTPNLDIPSRGERSRVLLLGGSGYLGGAIARRLQHSLTIADVRPPNCQAFDYVHVDIRDKGSVLAAMDGHEIVVHLAALHGPDCDRGVTDHELETVNVIGTANVIGACESLSVKHLIFVSSASVYGSYQRRTIEPSAEPRPTSAYGWSKLRAERVVLAGRTPSFVLRPAQFTFPDYETRVVKFLTAAVDIDDLAWAICNLARTRRTSPRPLNLAAPSPLDDSTDPERSASRPDTPEDTRLAVSNVLSALNLSPPARLGKILKVSSLPPELTFPYKDFWSESSNALRQSTGHPRWLRPTGVSGVAA